MSLAALRLKITALSEEMRDAAEAGEWDRASELGGVRRELLEALFRSREGTDVTEDPAEVVGLIRNILESDSKLSALAARARGQVSHALSEHRHGRRAVGAYREAASAEI